MDNVKVAEELVKIAKEVQAYDDDDMDWVISPINMISRAIRSQLITPSEARSRDMKDAAYDVAVGIRDSWSEGQGFGSSDGTYAIKNMLDSAGIPNDFINGKLERLNNEEGIKKLYKKYYSYIKGPLSKLNDEMENAEKGESADIDKSIRHCDTIKRTLEILQKELTKLED